jgi:hypothetical protein
MKIVYIILAHTNFKQSMRLYNRLNKDDTSFVFHISKTCERHYYRKMYTALHDQPNCYFSKRAVVRWGDFGVIQGTLNAIETIYDNHLDYDYAILLSGQSYPLKSHSFICQSLEKYQGKQLCEVIPPSEIEKDWAHRIETYHFWLGNRRFWYPHKGRRNKFIASLLDFLISPFIPKNKSLPEEYTLYKGSLWWMLTKDCVEYIYQHNRTEAGKKLIKFLKTTRHSGETYFQTVLMNSVFKDSIVNKDLRFILWLDTNQHERGHPETLTIKNFKDIASSESLFGRKFDINVDEEILDLIDRHILKTSENRDSL